MDIVRVIVTCGSCGNDFNQDAVVEELVVHLTNAICPLCEKDNSGLNIITDSDSWN